MLKKIVIGFAGLLIVALLAGPVPVVEPRFLRQGGDRDLRQRRDAGDGARFAREIVAGHGAGIARQVRVGSPRDSRRTRRSISTSISITLDPYSVAGTGPVVIKEITIEKPDVVYEVIGDGNNLQAIARNARVKIRRFMAKRPRRRKSPRLRRRAAEKKAGGKAPERKLIIDSLSIRGGDVTIIHPLLRGRKISTRLPPIQLNNIGRAEGGVTRRR